MVRQEAPSGAGVSRSQRAYGILSKPRPEVSEARTGNLMEHKCPTIGPTCSLASLLVGESWLRSRHELTRHRSEEHTSELQSLRHLVCRLLLEKKKIIS